MASESPLSRQSAVLRRCGRLAHVHPFKNDFLDKAALAVRRLPGDCRVVDVFSGVVQQRRLDVVLGGNVAEADGDPQEPAVGDADLFVQLCRRRNQNIV